MNQNGEHSNGKIRIEKPGKIRIDFEDNNKSLIGDGRKIALINKKFSQITYYNYDQIPLKVLLSTEFSLESFIVKDFVDYENIIEIELSENNTKNNGSIRLIFENKIKNMGSCLYPAVLNFAVGFFPSTVSTRLYLWD